MVDFIYFLLNGLWWLAVGVMTATVCLLLGSILLIILYAIGLRGVGDGK